jgi:molybdate transport system substrate-binding protein
MKKLISVMLTVLMIMSVFSGCTSKPAEDTTTTAQASVAESGTTTDSDTTKTQDSTTLETPASTSEEPVELTILAAASLTDVTKELAELYQEAAPNVALIFSYGSSGALQTQIEEGAPADIFLSAASKQMNALEEEDLLLAGTRKDLLLNKVVLIVPSDSTLALTAFEEVANETVKSVALGEPEGVPVGQYAEQVFTSLGIVDAVKAKTNYGSDVKQVLTWVESGEVDCGVVYSTDTIISDKVSVVCEAPEGSHEDIIYPAAVIESSAFPEAAKAFLEFLSTDEAAAVFEKYGFSMK